MWSTYQKRNFVLNLQRGALKGIPLTQMEILLSSYRVKFPYRRDEEEEMADYHLEIFHSI